MVSDPSFLAQIAQKFIKNIYILFACCPLSRFATICMHVQWSKFPLLAAESCETRLLSGGKEILIAACIFIDLSTLFHCRGDV